MSVLDPIVAFPLQYLIVGTNRWEFPRPTLQEPYRRQLGSSIEYKDQVSVSANGIKQRALSA